ncbi:MAG TPA: DivIVA domain-containing protein [Acidimicrobiales bacterium]|nr:DivIVA domain-containing protein [Acidimicrobiales bacterium]
MPPSVDLDDGESLRRAYVDEGRSLSGIAAMAGCSYATVRRALLGHGIEIRRSGPAPIESLRNKQWLQARAGEGRSAKEIAEELGCAEGTVRSALQWAGVPAGAARDRPLALDDARFLEKAYVTDRRSVRSIADEVGCTKDAVLAALRAHGVLIRGRGRAAKPGASSGPAPERDHWLAELGGPPSDGEVRDAPVCAQETLDNRKPAPESLRAPEPRLERQPEPVQPEPVQLEPDPKPEPVPSESRTVEPPPLPAPAPQRPSEPAPAPEPAPTPEPEPQSAPESEPQPTSEPAPEPEPQPTPEPEPQPPPQPTPEPEPALVADQQAWVGPEPPTVDVVPDAHGGATLASAHNPPSLSDWERPITAHAPRPENGATVTTPRTPPLSTTEEQPHRSAFERQAVPPVIDGTPARVDAEIDKIEAMTFSVTRRGYDRQEVDAFLRAVARDYRKVVKSAREAVNAARAAAHAPATPAPATPAPAPTPLPAPAAPTFEEIGGRVTAVLNSAAEAAGEIKESAEKEALAIRQRAREEAERLRRSTVEALAQAEQARAASEQQKAEAEATARSQADLILAEAQRQATQLEAEARERLTLMDRTVRANIDAVIAEARRDYEHLRSAQQQCIDRLASVEFLAKHARDGLSESSGQPLDELL